jgi:hypothetical protein
MNIVTDPVPVTNTNPNPPTINAIPSVLVSTPVDFTINGTDPDGDRLYYEVDWDNNGLVDVRSPAAGLVDSGISQTVQRSFSSADSVVIRARTVDELGARSAWTSHLLLVNDPSPVVPLNLQASGFSVISTFGFDSATGVYDTVVIGGVVRNTTTETLPSSSYNLSLTSLGILESGSIPSLTGLSSATVEVTFSDVLFGLLPATLQVDSANVITESNESDNNFTGTITLQPPAPNLNLSTSKEIVNSGEAVRLSWDVQVSYPMNCSVYWQGNETTFNPAIDGSAGEITLTDPINSTSNFLLSCTQTSTNTTYTDSVRVEVIGTQFEV